MPIQYGKCLNRSGCSLAYTGELIRFDGEPRCPECGEPLVTQRAPRRSRRIWFGLPAAVLAGIVIALYFLYPWTPPDSPKVVPKQDIAKADPAVTAEIVSMPSGERDSHLLEILKTLSDHEVRFVVAGGVAVVLHGVERMTLDLDIAVSLERANLTRFLSAMQQLNLEPRAPVPAVIILDQPRLEALTTEKNALVFTFWSPREPYRQIDMFLTQENSFDDLASDAQAIPIAGRAVLVASPRKLIEMKKRVQPLREKDLSDIRALQQIERLRRKEKSGE